MRRRRAPRSIVITGASGGIGRALAAELAAPGRTLLLLGRDRKRLDAAVDAAARRGATAEVAAVDLRDGSRLAEVIAAFDAAHPVDLLVVNAGVKTGNRDGIEASGQGERVVTVNLLSAIRTVETLLPALRARGAGWVAIVGSLAGVAPHADLLSYSASKAGLHAYATALRRGLRGSGVGVTTVIPGFVDTPMTERQAGPTPMRVTAEAAARRIARGIERRRAVVAFPLPLILAAWLLERLPASVSDTVTARFRADILPDGDEGCVRDDDHDPLSR
jgi:short-subunit dehydrogenase